MLAGYVRRSWASAARSCAGSAAVAKVREAAVGVRVVGRCVHDSARKWAVPLRGVTLVARGVLVTMCRTARGAACARSARTRWVNIVGSFPPHSPVTKKGPFLVRDPDGEAKNHTIGACTAQRIYQHNIPAGHISTNHGGIRSLRLYQVSYSKHRVNALWLARA